MTLTAIPNLRADPLLPAYRWNEAARRYVADDGRFVGAHVVRGELDRVLDRLRGEASTLADMLRAGDMNLATWQQEMMGLNKRSHLAGAALERGGWFQMSQADFGRAGQLVRSDYGFLRDFALEIGDGRQLLDGTLANRARLYAQAGRETYYEFGRLAATAAGYHLVRSVRGATDSCDDCVNLDGVVFEIGDPDYLPVGQRICNANCKCSEEYLNADGEVLAR